MCLVYSRWVVHGEIVSLLLLLLLVLRSIVVCLLLALQLSPVLGFAFPSRIHNNRVKNRKEREENARGANTCILFSVVVGNLGTTDRLALLSSVRYPHPEHMDEKGMMSSKKFDVVLLLTVT